jgi:hypothetical protein
MIDLKVLEKGLGKTSFKKFFPTLPNAPHLPHLPYERKYPYGL